jgi:hypothetical protein
MRHSVVDLVTKEMALRYQNADGDSNAFAKKQ